MTKFANASLILTHEAAIPFHIGTEDRGELALDVLRVHGVFSTNYKKERERHRYAEGVSTPPLLDKRILVLREGVKEKSSIAITNVV